MNKINARYKTELKKRNSVISTYDISVCSSVFRSH